MSGGWWWCMKHQRAESDGSTDCPPEDRMGPYESQEAAEHWKERVESRNEKWDREDREWSGEED